MEPIEPPPEPCCFLSVRYDPFDLIFRRVTFEGEVTIWGPITAQLSPSIIFDSPSENMTESGFDLGADIAWYVMGDAMRGFWVKGHFEYEFFEATLYRGDSLETAIGKPGEMCDRDSAAGTCTRTVQSTILGAMIGSSTVFGRDWGFALSGGIGIGVALADPVELRVDPCGVQDAIDRHPSCPAGEDPSASGLASTYYDKAERIRLLGSLGLGLTF
jgi:hypothetical protein